MTEVKPRHPYDVADWKPIKPEEWVINMCTAACTVDNPETLKVEVDDLDGRIRLVVYATLKHHDVKGEAYGGSGPYLMALFEAEDERLVCFEQRKLELATA